MISIVGGATRAAPPQVQPRLDLQAAAGCTWKLGESWGESNKAIFSETWLHLHSKLWQHVQHATLDGAAKDHVISSSFPAVQFRWKTVPVGGVYVNSH